MRQFFQQRFSRCGGHHPGGSKTCVFVELEKCWTVLWILKICKNNGLQFSQSLFADPAPIIFGGAKTLKFSRLKNLELSYGFNEIGRRVCGAFQRAFFEMPRTSFSGVWENRETVLLISDLVGQNLAALVCSKSGNFVLGNFFEYILGSLKLIYGAVCALSRRLRAPLHT